MIFNELSVEHFQKVVYLLSEKFSWLLVGMNVVTGDCFLYNV